MDQNRENELHQINYLSSEMDALYHRASWILGITDSTSVVLYAIYDSGDSCLLSDIYKRSGARKQTINSAIRKLEKDGIIYLEQMDGRTKKVILTESGKDYVKKTIAKLYHAEKSAYESWTAEEINIQIQLMKKYIESFREQVDMLEKEII